MSPTLKFLNILFHLWQTSNVAWTSFFHLLQNSFAQCCTHLYCFLPYMSSFWNSPGRGMTTLDFIISNYIRHIGTGLWTSDKDSDVMGLVLTITSTSASNVWSDSSFRLIPCILSSVTKIECAYLICRSHMPGRIACST